MRFSYHLLLAIILGLGLGLHTAPAEAFRCGNRIVSEGDDISRVYHVCGEPSATQHWTELKIRRVHSFDLYYPIHLPVEIQVEEWTYNLGSHRFMRRLRFENGRLVKILELEYGH